MTEVASIISRKQSTKADKQSIKKECSFSRNVTTTVKKHTLSKQIKGFSFDNDDYSTTSQRQTDRRGFHHDKNNAFCQTNPPSISQQKKIKIYFKHNITQHKTSTFLTF